MKSITLSRFKPKRHPTELVCGTSRLVEVGDHSLRVAGGITHGVEIEPASIEDARRWVDWLNAWILRQHRIAAVREIEKAKQLGDGEI